MTGDAQVGLFTPPAGEVCRPGPHCMLRAALARLLDDEMIGKSSEATGL